MGGYRDQPPAWQIVDYPACYHCGAGGFYLLRTGTQVRRNGARRRSSEAFFVGVNEVHESLDIVSMSEPSVFLAHL